jgi:ubiquinone/menaquinone biosynthesis C-methylase UbiE
MQDIILYYTQIPEEDRLARGWGALEFARTKEIMLRYLDTGPLTILDVGGGTGIYSEWLGELGHRMHLIDITPSHIATARLKRTRLASAEVGDSRHLAWPDRSVDVVLLLGPLYHLVEAAGRSRALSEAHRVLRPGGVAFVAGICRFAPLLASLLEGFFDDPIFHGVLLRDLAEGQHRNPSGHPRRFTTAYFHRPEELAQEMSDAGFQLIDVLPVEGPSWLANGSEAEFAACWSDPARRQTLLALARTVEHDPMSLAVSPHMIAIGRA